MQFAFFYRELRGKPRSPLGWIVADKQPPCLLAFLQVAHVFPPGQGLKMKPWSLADTRHKEPTVWGRKRELGDRAPDPWLEEKQERLSCLLFLLLSG